MEKPQRIQNNKNLKLEVVEQENSGSSESNVERNEKLEENKNEIVNDKL